MLPAAKGGHKLGMQWPIREEVNVNAEDYYGRRALHWAAKHGREEAVQLLVDERAAFNAVDRSGMSALVLAAKSRQRLVARLLLIAGAHPALEAQGISITFHPAAYAGSGRAVRLPPEKGASVEARKTGLQHYTSRFSFRMRLQCGCCSREARISKQKPRVQALKILRTAMSLIWRPLGKHHREQVLGHVYTLGNASNRLQFRDRDRIWVHSAIACIYRLKCTDAAAVSKPQIRASDIGLALVIGSSCIQ